MEEQAALNNLKRKREEGDEGRFGEGAPGHPLPTLPTSLGGPPETKRLKQFLDQQIGTATTTSSSVPLHTLQVKEKYIQRKEKELEVVRHFKHLIESYAIQIHEVLVMQPESQAKAERLAAWILDSKEKSHESVHAMFSGSWAGTIYFFRSFHAALDKILDNMGITKQDLGYLAKCITGYQGMEAEGIYSDITDAITAFMDYIHSPK